MRFRYSPDIDRARLVISSSWYVHSVGRLKGGDVCIVQLVGLWGQLAVTIRAIVCVSVCAYIQDMNGIQDNVLGAVMIVGRC